MATAARHNRFTPEVQRINAFSAFDLGHGVVDPLLEIIAKPRLYTVCEPDGPAIEEFRFGGPYFALVGGDAALRPEDRFQVAATNEHAQMPKAVKPQVAIDVEDGELREAG